MEQKLGRAEKGKQEEEEIGDPCCSREHSVKGNYHCSADLLLDGFGLDQTSKAVAHLTRAKQPNPIKINRRSAV